MTPKYSVTSSFSIGRYDTQYRNTSKYSIEHPATQNCMTSNVSGKPSWQCDIQYYITSTYTIERLDTHFCMTLIVSLNIVTPNVTQHYMTLTYFIETMTPKIEWHQNFPVNIYLDTQCYMTSTFSIEHHDTQYCKTLTNFSIERHDTSNVTLHDIKLFHWTSWNQFLHNINLFHWT